MAQVAAVNLQAERSQTEKAPEFDLQLKYWMAVHCLPLAAYFNSVQPHIMKSWVYSTIYAIGDLIYDLEIPDSWGILFRKPYDVSHDGRGWSEEMMLYDFAIYFVCHKEGKANAWTQQKTPWDGVYGPVGPGWNNTAWDHRPGQTSNSASDIVPKLVDYVYTCLNVLCKGPQGLPMANAQLNMATLWLPNCASKYWLGCWDLIEAMYVKGTDLILQWNNTPTSDKDMVKAYREILTAYPAEKNWYEANKESWLWTAGDIDRMWMQRRPIQQIYVTNIAGVRALIAHVENQKITLLEMWTRVASNSRGELLPFVSDWFFHMECEMFRGFGKADFTGGRLSRSRNEINRRAFESASNAMNTRIHEINYVLDGDRVRHRGGRWWDRFRNGENFIKKGKETTNLTWEVLTNTEDHYTAWKQWKIRDGEGLDTPKRNPQHDIHSVSTRPWTKKQADEFTDRVNSHNGTWANGIEGSFDKKVMMHINGLRRMICDGCGAPCVGYGTGKSGSPFSKYQASCYRCRRRNGQNTHEGAHKEIDATQQFQIIATLFFQKLAASDSLPRLPLSELFNRFHTTPNSLNTIPITFACPEIGGSSIAKSVVSDDGDNVVLNKTETTSWKSVMRDVLNVGKSALNQHPFIHADLGKIHGLADRIGDTTTAGINLKGVMEHVLTHGIPKPERCRQAAPKPTLEETVTAWANVIVYGLYGGCGGGLAENPSMFFFAPNPRDKILSIIPDDGTLRKLNRTRSPITDLIEVARSATIITMAGLLRPQTAIEKYITMRKEFKEATVAFFDKMISSMQNGSRYDGPGNGRQRLDQHEADRKYRDFLLGHKILNRTYNIREPFEPNQDGTRGDAVHKIDINSPRATWVGQIKNSIRAFWPYWDGNQANLQSERQELREADRFLPKILRFDKIAWQIELSDHRTKYMEFFDNLDADSAPWYPHDLVAQRVFTMLNNLYIRKNGRWQIRYVKPDIDERSMFENLHNVDSPHPDAREILFNETKIERPADGDEAIELWNEDLTKDRNCDFLGRPHVARNPWGINQEQVDEAEGNEVRLELLAEQIWDRNLYPFRLLVWAIGRNIDDNRLREQFVPLGANNNNRLAYAENNVTSITGGLRRPAYLIWTSADLRTIENMKDLGSYLCPFQVEKPTIMPSSTIFQILTGKDAYSFSYGQRPELENLLNENDITFSYVDDGVHTVKMPNYYLLTSAYTIHKWNHYHKIENYMAKVRNTAGVEIGWGSADPLRALERGANGMAFRKSLADENPGTPNAFGIAWVDDALQIPSIEGDALRPHSQWEIFMDGIFHVNHGPLDENLMLKNAGGKSSSGWNNEMRKMFVGWYRALSGAGLDLRYTIVPPGFDRSEEEEKTVVSFPRSYIIHRTLESMKEYDILQYLSNVSKGTAQAKIVVTTKRRNRSGVLVNGGRIPSNGNGGFDTLITKCESNVNVLFNEDPGLHKFENPTIRLYFVDEYGNNVFETARRIAEGYRIWYQTQSPGKQKEYWPPDKHALVLIYQKQ